jgi:polygalacturonase
MAHQITFGISRMAQVLALVCVAVVAIGAWAGCDVSMSDFGAVGDGVQYDDAALQAAFGDCPKGGRIVFPAGKYLLSPFNITSNMQLYLEKGSTLLASPDISRWPIVPPFPSYPDVRRATALREVSPQCPY